MHGKVEIKPHVRSMIDPDGAVLLDLREGKYYSLNGIGAHIWEQVETGADLGEILTHLVEKFSAAQDTLRSDLLGFVGSLEKKGLIHVAH